MIALSPSFSLPFSISLPLSLSPPLSLPLSLPPPPRFPVPARLYRTRGIAEGRALPLQTGSGMLLVG